MYYVIYSSSYDENIGGVISLHKLCHKLNSLGEEAYIFPAERPFKTNPKYISPVIGEIDNEAIVVYPEIVNGNPLGAKNVVRWFLNKPGVLNKNPNYGNPDEELYFFFVPPFNDPDYNKDESNILWVFEVFSDIYVNKGTKLEDRKGTCYILRKGINRPIVHNIESSINLDNLPHKIIAEYFNTCKYFLSYDLYTMYSLYAAMCGCISVVIPDPKISKEKWQEHIFYKYGIAYGIDDIPYALGTMDKLPNYLIELEKKSDELVKLFIQKTKSFFNGK